MFAVSTMRRASELRAPFLQCLQYFHTVSMVELQGMMPPDSNKDYDIHLVQAVQGLKTLSKDLVADIFVSYCGKNVPEDKTSNIYIHPSLVCKDLRKSGYKCWFKENSIKHVTDEMAKALMDAEVFLVFISNEYVNDEECCNLFKYARLTLHKPIILVVVGSGMEWKSSRLGILLADEVFVSMLQVERYKTKFEELLKVIKVRVQKEAAEQQFPPCFISYCWQNSAQAVARGTRPRKGGVGHGDPRAIKQYLDEQGIPCWLDVERVGLHGLFEDIAEGLLQAKLVIVCVSDEYSTSANCCMEFRYAANTLKLPIILAVVGTGNAWRASEIGVLTLKYPLVSFQENNQASYDKLLTKVRELLPHPDTYTPAILQQEKEHVDTEEKDLSYQELCELAQRKFLRQIVQYADKQEVEAPYPRLLLLDYVPEKKTDEEAGEEMQQSGHEEMFKHPMCIHILCEHDEGWHACSEPLPLSLDLATIEKSIPYIARISAIARYSKILVMNCLATSLGQEFIKWMQESPQVVTFSDFRQIYHDFRQEVINADPQRIMGNLARCHLPNGKLMWLCEEHRNKMRVTVLSDEMTMSSHGSSEPVGVDYMLQALRELDYRQVPSAIRHLAGLEEPQAADTPKKKALHEKLQRTDDPNKADRPDSKRSHTCSQNTSAQQLVSPAQRSLKTRSSQGNPPQFGNRIKSKACNIM